MAESFASANVEIEVPFHDIDVMGIAWHGHYAKYLELARTELLLSIDYDVEEMRASGFLWPVIELHVRYVQPLEYRQRIRVKAELVEYENRLKIKYLIEDVASGQRLSRAYTVQVAVDGQSNEMLFASPPVLLRKLGLE